MRERNYLTNDAANEYLECCRFSLWMGILGPSEFLGRLNALKALCRPQSPIWNHCAVIAEFEGCVQDDDWGDRDIAEIERVGLENTRSIKVYSDPEGGEPLIMQFIPSVSSGLGAWEFHKGDADPHPSVPHGHDRANDKRKLDPYLGYISFLGRQTGRVKRDSTVALWNDRAFRQFAREALEHFMSARPGWRWRVANPMRLPRARK